MCSSLTKNAAAVVVARRLQLQSTVDDTAIVHSLALCDRIAAAVVDVDVDCCCC